MNPARRAALGLVATGFALPALSQQQSSWPARPLTLVVPFPPGGAADGIARAVARRAEPLLGGTIVVENRPGAGTLLGSEHVARAPADGYTLLVISSALPSALALRGTAPVRLEQFAAVTAMAEAPLALVVRNGLPAANVAELVAHAKRQSQTLSAATNGVGTTSHLMAAKFGIDAGFGITDVPYPGAAQAWQDLIGGRVDMYFDALQGALPHTKAGRARLLAITASARSAASPDTPTMSEAGFPSLVNSPWWGIAAPAGTPEAVLRRLERAFVDAGQAADVRSNLVAFGARPVFNPSAEASALLRRDFDFWSNVIQKANIKVQ